jgi:lipopolysaccharide/colanic/teichoic acid biosynthesis glycosyltransferase
MNSTDHKRRLDVLLAGAGLLLTALPMGLIATAIKFTSGSPILFRQTRIGLHGKSFDLFKFRTMSDARDLSGNPLPDEHRVTRLGHLLRSTSLDELPELLNVLRGDMSLVGPRPLLLDYIDRYTPEQARRHEIRPGVTGLAQVEGRNGLTWERKFEFDIMYIDNWSLRLDIRILARTFVAVITRRGISDTGGVGAHPFMGTPPCDGGGDFSSFPHS